MTNQGHIYSATVDAARRAVAQRNKQHLIRARREHQLGALHRELIAAWK